MALSAETGNHSDLLLSADNLRLDTLVRLRWLAIAGQTAAVLFVHYALGFALPLLPALALIGVSALLNLGLRLRFPESRRLGAAAAGLLLGYDVLQLAGLLFLTGGLQNPFAVLFLAPVLISATAMPPPITLSLGLLAVGCASLLAFFHRPLPWSGEPPSLPFLYVAGVWSALTLALGFIGTYAFRVAKEARQLAEALTATELVLAREQHLSALDGLAVQRHGERMAEAAVAQPASRMSEDQAEQPACRIVRQAVAGKRGRGDQRHIVQRTAGDEIGLSVDEAGDGDRGIVGAQQDVGGLALGA